MIDCISVENMRLSDAKTIDSGVSGIELMNRAAKGVFSSVIWNGSVAIIAGSGNNGGDGFALASILRENGIRCTVFSLSSKLSPDSAFYAQKATAVGIDILPFGTMIASNNLASYDIVVDCLLGTGFRGQLRENYKDAIRCINQSGAYVVSVDINSGLCGDSGEAEIAVMSDLTVTIGYIKTGLIMDSASAYIKRLVCTDIGITLFKKEHFICSATEWLSLCAANGTSPGSTQVTIAGKTYFLAPKWLEID